LQENSDYEEAKAHWEQDLRNAKPDDIEVQVTDFNNDIEEFFSITAHDIVATAVRTNFMVFESYCYTHAKLCLFLNSAKYELCLCS